MCTSTWKMLSSKPSHPTIEPLWPNRPTLRDLQTKRSLSTHNIIIKAWHSRSLKVLRSRDSAITRNSNMEACSSKMLTTRTLWRSTKSSRHSKRNLRRTISRFQWATRSYKPMEVRSNWKAIRTNKLPLNRTTNKRASIWLMSFATYSRIQSLKFKEQITRTWLFSRTSRVQRWRMVAQTTIISIDSSTNKKV
jgi:hypothetical protein